MMESLLQPQWWHWIVGGILLTLAELAIPAFYIIWFGLGALLVGLLLLIVPVLSPPTQIGVWILASIAMTVLWFRVFQHSAAKTQSGSASGEVIGECGLLVATVEPYAMGKVRFQRPLLGADEWPCLADEQIAAGERVRVTAIEGSFLKVVKHGA